MCRGVRLGAAAVFDVYFSGSGDAGERWKGGRKRSPRVMFSDGDDVGGEQGETRGMGGLFFCECE